MDQRRFIYIYSLAYPAVLGSFLFGFIANSGLDGERLGAALVMLVYFLLQFGEGMATGQKLASPDPAVPPESVYCYGWLRLIQDVVEILCLVWVFAALGFFDTGGTPSRLAPLVLGTHWSAMAAAFTVPPLFRFVRLGLGDRLPESDRPNDNDRNHVIGLSLLSGLAVALCLLEALYWNAPFLTLAGILALLIVYFGAYILNRAAPGA